MKRIEVPGQGIVEFPDDMTDEQIVSAIKKNMPQEPSKIGGVLSEAMRGMRLGSFPGAVVGGMAAAIPPLSDIQDKIIGRAGYEGGGYATDLATKTGMSPEAAGVVGVIANAGVQAIPALLGGELARPLSAPMKSGARRLMQSALKPDLKHLKNGKAAIAIDTMLEKGFNPTKGGVEKMKARVNDLNFEIKSMIANSPETVNKGEVGKRLLDEFNKFKNQVNPDADLETIRKAWMEFRGHPLLSGKSDIPVQIAQDIKQGTNKLLAKKYGQLGTADDAAQKALVRGLKEEIARKVPAVSGLNAEESRLLSTLEIADKRALMEGNKNIAGLGPLAENPSAAISFLADRSALIKSLLARFMYSNAESLPVSAGRVGGLLYGTYQKKQHGH